MDNHPAHRNLDEALQAAGIPPYPMASYCGEFTGIERLWAWLRERNLHSVFFQRVAEVKAAIREFFCAIAGVKDQVVACGAESQRFNLELGTP